MKVVVKNFKLPDFSKNRVFEFKLFKISTKNVCTKIVPTYFITILLNYVINNFDNNCYNRHIILAFSYIIKEY